MSEFEHVTTDAAVEVYESSAPIFHGLFGEVRELSKKRPEATMSASKVKIINRVLDELLLILKEEPTGKYLEALDDQSLPQMSDAVFTMVQFETALAAFRTRYRQDIGLNDYYWITESFVAHKDEDSEELKT